MNDDVTPNPGSGGTPFRAFSDGTREWAASVVSYVSGGSANAWTLQPIDATHGLPTNLSQVGGTAIALGQGLMAGSLPVVLASNQTGIPITTVKPDGTNTMPSLDAAARAGFVKVTDGTNSQPAMDVAGRAGFVKLTDGISTIAIGQGLMAASLPVVLASNQTAIPISTVKPDGTNTMPSLDAAARAGFVKVTDGTNSQPAMDVAARAGFVKLTDGTNTAPTFDAAGRAGHVNLNLGGTAVDGNSGNKSNGTVRVVLATDQPALTTAQPVNDRPATAGGLTMHKAISAASTNGTSVKASAGQVYDIEVYNLNASPRYLKLYNKASAPTVGTDTPVKTLLIPGNTAGAGLVKNWDKGLEFTTGIAYALTTGIADADTGAVGANEVAVNIDYK